MVIDADEIIDDILRREGGFVNHPADRGGATKYGITLAALTDWRNAPTTVEHVENMTEVEAREIYRQRYLVGPGLHKILDPQVRALAVDCAVNHGPRNAIKMLQEAAHVFADGRLGPKSEAAINRMDARALYRRVCAERAKFYGRLITRDPSQSVFAAGWMHRLAEFICQP